MMVNSLVKQVVDTQTFISEKFKQFKLEYEQKGGKFTLNVAKQTIKASKYIEPKKRLNKNKHTKKALDHLHRCINILRFFTEHEHFSGKGFIQILEEEMKPILRYAANPEEIEFDDDLVFCIEALVKKQRGCDQVLLDIFPYLRLFQEKNKGTLANLTQCMNAFIIFGKHHIQDSEVNVNILLDMISKALVLEPQMANSTYLFSNNVEGCLLLSLALQNFDPPRNEQQSHFHVRLPQILKVVFDILKAGQVVIPAQGECTPRIFPINSFFKKHLLEVVLSALFFDADFTFTIIEEY
mmetsp:Transcript_30524/g.46787  ORF Transcript_30524/g.46787 Transcript_30524/m.46787 type:complete len:296 (-) Transcript_30524:1001-1888(-)